MQSTAPVAQIEDENTQAPAYDNDVDDLSDIPPLVEHSEIDNWHRRLAGDDSDDENDYLGGSQEHLNKRFSALNAKRESRVPTPCQLIQAVWNETFCGELSSFQNGESSTGISLIAPGDSGYTTTHHSLESDTKDLDDIPQAFSESDVPLLSEKQVIRKGSYLQQWEFISVGTLNISPELKEFISADFQWIKQDKIQLDDAHDLD